MGYKCCAENCRLQEYSSSIRLHSFPKDSILREKWVESLKKNYKFEVKKCHRICTKHFEEHYIIRNVFGNVKLKPEAIPTVFVHAQRSLFKECSTPRVIQKSTRLSTGTDTLAVTELNFSPTVTSPTTYNDVALNSLLKVSSPVSSKNVQTLKVGTKETPKKDVLCRQLKIEKKCRLQVEKSVLALSNQLTEYGSSENFTKLCEKHFSPSILTDVKSYTNCKTRNPHGYRYTNGIKQPALT